MLAERNAAPAARREYLNSWRRDNREKVSAYEGARRAALLQRAVPWADRLKIAEFYVEAVRLTRETGVQHHVDHIIPLRGELISGLHVETNLQVITAGENLRKKNLTPWLEAA